MDLYVRSSFVLLNSNKLVETPELIEEYDTFAFNMYKDTIEEQLYLSDLGVPFSYTDTIDAQTRRDLIQIAVNWREEHPKRTGLEGLI